ncbi:MAG: BREX system P-loop protein BrxC [Planctomycetes bacterium]|nr:BREX system P-loop protein BrxC [Planctomycetota bacterium]
MRIHQLLDRDPRQSALANGGQARISTATDAHAQAELRAELETFVCDGQYGDALERMLRSYLTQLDRPRQNAAWVSGFFGSGKSHLLKMLGHLWVNTNFADGSTARNLVRALPDEVVAALRELDTQAARTGRVALAASGALPSGSGDHVRLTVLSIVMRACGLPESYAQAQFVFWLRGQGYLERVRGAVERTGKDWSKELHNLYVSGPIAQAVLACDPNFARDEREARQVLRDRFPNPVSDVTTPQFLAACREALAPAGQLPLTVLILDEVQQYIGDATDRAVTITEIAEAVQTQLESRVLLVASGQSALSGTPLLQKLKDRFRINVQLSDTDVEAVTRKVLLHKKASAVEPIRATLGKNAGEVSKQLQGTRLAERPSDREIALLDYPLLPTRRRFWEECFRAVDAAGTHSQLRSQLRILHDALRGIAECELGAVIPGDALFDAIGPDLVNSGFLLGELATRIQEQANVPEVGPLRKRICGLVFLISKLPREQGVDAGVRATARTLADLLVDQLEADSGPFRREVEKQLEAMASGGTLMKVGDEYRLQTTQGAEWDRAFREQQGALGGRIAELQAKQDQLFAAAVQRLVSEIRPKHGESKVPRSLSLHARPDAPSDGGGEVVVWLRDGSSSSQKDVESEARRRGHEDPVIHVFLPKPTGDLRARIVEVEAARAVLDAKGMPTEPPEAREACESMQSRFKAAEAARDELIRELVASAKVLQGGGNEVYGDSFRAKLDAAVEASLARLFPRFAEGDHKAWPVALRRAREGSDEPLKILGWDRPTEEHPVLREVLLAVGNGVRGTELRKSLEASPYGWPRDTIDAALIALHRIGTLRAVQNGQPIAPGQLDQNKISSAEFRPEKHRLSAPDKVALRGLYQKAGIKVVSGEEELKAASFLDALLALARAAGGDAPLPSPPATKGIEDLRRLAGSEQLVGILAAREELESALRDWSALKEKALQRLPGWTRLQRLARCAEGLPILAELRPEMDAIARNRSLLDDTDYVAPLAKKLELALREELRRAHARCSEIFTASQAELEGSESWQKLASAEREALLRAQRLEPIGAPELADEAQLLAALEARSLRGWNELADGLPTRFAKARAEAARAQEPKVQHLSLRSDLLRTEADVERWLAVTRADLFRRLADGPLSIG